jgi:hypothetical protein
MTPSLTYQTQIHISATQPQCVEHPFPSLFMCLAGPKKIATYQRPNHTALSISFPHCSCASLDQKNHQIALTQRDRPLLLASAVRLPPHLRIAAAAPSSALCRCGLASAFPALAVPTRRQPMTMMTPPPLEVRASSYSPIPPLAGSDLCGLSLPAAREPASIKGVRVWSTVYASRRI